MKHRIYQIFATGMMCCGMAAALTACSNDDYLGGHYTTEGAGTILNVTAQTDKAWADGDIIGIAAGYGQNDGTARDLLGRVVDGDYHGIVIVKGQKLIR